MVKTSIKFTTGKFILLQVLILTISILLFACSSSIERNIQQDDVDLFYAKAMEAEIKYGDEPVPGVLRPFPSSFALTGKVLWIQEPCFDSFEAMLPAEIYKVYALDGYDWYTNDSSEVQYIILIDTYFSPSDEYGLGNTLIFTIIDLSYGEMVYKSFLSGLPGAAPPFDELAELLESIVL